MVLKDIFALFFNALQLKIPLVLGNKFTYLVSIYDILIGCILGFILFTVMYFLITGQITKSKED